MTRSSITRSLTPEYRRNPLFTRGWALLPFIAVTGCATVPSGDRALVISPLGAEETIDEGTSLIFPFSRVDYFDLRAQERNEDLIGLTAEGAPVIARSSLVTYRIDPDGLSALDHELGPDYYDVLIKPLLYSTVRKVFASYPWLELDSDHIIQAQKRITKILRDHLKPYPIVLEGVEMREVLIDLSGAYREVEDTEVWKENVLKSAQEIKVARAQADALRRTATGVFNSHRLIAPTLTGRLISDTERRAWGDLISSPTSTVKVIGASPPSLVEVTP